MKIIKTKEELCEVVKDYFMNSGNEKSAVKIRFPGFIMYLTKGLYQDYIENITWKYSRVTVKLLERQCIFSQPEFEAIINHPADSCGCIFYFHPDTPDISFSIHPLELPAISELQELLAKDILPEPEGDVKVIGISRYDFLQDVKEWVKGENKVTSWEG